jgi:hypothetical protein
MRFWVAAIALLFAANTSHAAPLPILYLGDGGHHQPKARFDQLQPVLAERGIDLTYSSDPNILSKEGLAPYKAVVVYANIDNITPAQEAALIEYVQNGGGFVPLHCASFCFRNSPKYVALVGAQFSKHGTGIVETRLEAVDHPILKGFSGFRSWDETYRHSQHNPIGRTVLEYHPLSADELKRDPKAPAEEPWTWVRDEGKGRVFYTAWGHDDRTFSNPGFQNLVERGIRWAARDATPVPEFKEQPSFQPPAMTTIKAEAAPFGYIDVGSKIPNYVAGAQWGKQEKPLTQMQLPLPPEKSLEHYVHPQGSELKLFAADPQLGGKPIAFNWDEAGRLWVCETMDYPNELQPKGQGRDRIRIVTDTDNDGVADRFDIFAEGLSIPSAIVCVRGGAIVQDGTETVFLKDTNGDGKADVRKLLVSGWALGDTHGGVSNFQYGLDNWIWAMQGYNDSQPILTNGQRAGRFKQGFFRFKVTVGADGLPEVNELEFIRSTNNNTWGLGISEDGLIFGSTANHNPSVYMPIANRYYERVRGWAAQGLGTIADTHLFKPITPKVRQVDHHGGYTAGCGHSLYTARNYPESWWNRTAFVCGPTGHLVGTFVLTQNGTDFTSTSPSNLVASDDEWAAPIMAEVGPDGNMWILDWYNYIIQHNPTPTGFTTGKGNAYESDLRDKKHGRVLRLIWNNRPDTSNAPDHSTTRNLAGAGNATLLKALEDTNFFWRKQAQRLLVERNDASVAPALLARLGVHHLDAIGLDVGAIHSAWTLQGLGQLNSLSDPQVVQGMTAGLTHPSAAVRRNVIQTLPAVPQTPALLARTNVANDPQPLVRLATFLALADAPATAESAAIIAQALRDPAVFADRYLPEALTAAAARNDALVIEALSEKQAAKSAGLPKASLAILQRLAEHTARGEHPLGGAVLLSQLSTMPPEAAEAMITGLSKGWSRKAAEAAPEVTPAQSEAITKLFRDVAPASRSQLLALSQRMGLKTLEKYAGELAADFLAKVNDANLGEADRIAAALDYVALLPADPDVAAKLIGQLSVKSTPQFTTGLLNAVAKSESPATGAAILERLGNITPGSRPQVMRTLLARSDWTEALLAACSSGKLSLGELPLDQQQALAAHPDPKIQKLAREIMAKGGGLANADRQAVIEQPDYVTKETGDPVNGKLVYTQQCAKCHVYGDLGQKVGPNLTGMSVHPKHELLVHILDPSRSVEGNYRAYTVVLDDGRVFTGLLASETRTTIELLDVEGKPQSIQRDEIEELVASTKSLMPEGFEKQITPTGLKDLLEFLKQPGKYLPLPLDKFATINTTQGMFYSADADQERLMLRSYEPRTIGEVPFAFVDPKGKTALNAIMLFSQNGKFPPQMPKQVTIPCGLKVKTIHLLGGVGGWAFPASGKGSTSMIVRLKYADGSTEDHKLINGEHIADYIRRVDVPQSEFALSARGQQLRTIKIDCGKELPLESIELVKGPDGTAPVIMAITLETGNAPLVKKE